MIDIVLLTCRVAGTPVPQGSTRAFSRGGKVFTTNDPQGTLARWRGDIRTVVQQGWEGSPALDALTVFLIFEFARPKSHMTKIGLAKGAPHHPGPDIDKLARGVLDALTGVAYLDDSQVVDLRAEKRYIPPDRPSGVQIVIGRLIE